MFGITPSMAIEKTKAKLKVEAELVEGITLKMKSYIGDVDQVIDILDIQDEYSVTENKTRLDEIDKILPIKRARIDNQVLIKNYNFSEFLADIASTYQDCMNYMISRDEQNCFPAYIIDYTWKCIQMKLAFMVRNLNYKVKNDFKDKDRQTREEI